MEADELFDENEERLGLEDALKAYDKEESLVGLSLRDESSELYRDYRECINLLLI